MTFSQRLSNLMDARGISAYRIYKDLKIPDSLIGYWKKGLRNPSSEQLLKLSEYFHVTVDYLLGNEQKESPAVYDDEAKEYLDELRKRPEMKMLFKASKNATKEEIEQVVKMIETFKRGSGGDE